MAFSFQLRVHQRYCDRRPTQRRPFSASGLAAHYLLRLSRLTTIGQSVCVGFYDCLCLWGSKPIITGFYKAVTVGMVAGACVRVLARVKVQGYGMVRWGSEYVNGSVWSCKGAQPPWYRRKFVNACLRVCVCELSKSFTSTSPHRPFPIFVQVFVKTISFPSPSMDPSEPALH